ncbi:MAG: hydrogenase maturation protease, partial [Methanomicrobiales archaeon]|nr:hydrogenase maturation protease [Methanomicrobiales archaeon]
MLYPEIVVVGCGNPLFVDDGFGTAVIEELQQLQLPDNVKVIDAGLGAPHFIFTLLDEETTKKLVIIDIADFGAEPGNVTTIPIE